MPGPASEKGGQAAEGAAATGPQGALEPGHLGAAHQGGAEEAGGGTAGGGEEDDHKICFIICKIINNLLLLFHETEKDSIGVFVD